MGANFSTVMEKEGKNKTVKVVSSEIIYQYISYYRKNSKNWDTLNYYLDCPTNGIVGF